VLFDAQDEDGPTRNYSALIWDRGAVLFANGHVGRDRGKEFGAALQKMAHSIRRRDDVFQSLRCQ